jgi:predicted proteasome-type protease
MAAPYHKSDVTVVFKASNRANSKVKIKTYRNRSIDDVLSSNKMVGVPLNAVILEMGIGDSFEVEWKKKYKLK